MKASHHAHAASGKTGSGFRKKYPGSIAKRKIFYIVSRITKGIRMLDVRQTILDALPKDLLLDLEDRLRAEALKANSVVQRELALNPKRSREAEGQIRFRLQEQGYEEVVQLHGGHLLTDGVVVGTNLKVFQPFARFVGPQTGVILGFASMPERKKIPPKNMSRAAGVTLNVSLQSSLFSDERSPKPTDIFVLFLTARDRERGGMIEEIAIGVIGSDYKDFVFYESLENFLGGYGSETQTPPAKPQDPQGGGSVVKLREARKLFVPPETRRDKESEDGTGE
ncbi:hypothetical protein N2601_33575 (plasmid) [Rhizobium sp. CB3060]|uniref:hypothetical protein n=1 Tax=Rhizobium sp. CB3060 TaxID=3138255 RepID=UPI0021A8702E|nr:hypothetical protein [Rhizobium tropici]UWU26178.1 hypothetical protein N2601_33575 [Rhizobium tropici]